jgi:D-alanyl-D-alanine-carboxypeptidase/D-alanyl-D-alanine-endopeptidase
MDTSILIRLAGIAWLVMSQAAMAAAPDAGPVLTGATDLGGAIMFMESHAPGMILVAIHGDHQPDGNSLFRLNSITKVFATESLVTLAADGKLRLTDPLQRFAGDVHAPQIDGHSITLLDLATHSAALPQEIGDAPTGAGARNWPTRSRPPTASRIPTCSRAG